MDQDQLDEETITRILRFLVRAASRHEQQLTSLEADRSYVFFLEVGHHGLIGMLVQASQSKRKLCQPAGTTYRTRKPKER